MLKCNCGGELESSEDDADIVCVDCGEMYYMCKSNQKENKCILLEKAEEKLSKINTSFLIGSPEWKRIDLIINEKKGGK